MVEDNINTSTNNNDDINTNSNNNNASFSYNTNIQNNQDFNESVNRSLDQTKDNINRSIEESKNQIPHYNNIVNNYQEQTLQAVKVITENFIESQKTIIRSIQSAWGPYQQNFNASINTWNSPEAIANAYSRFVSNVADNTVTYLRTTNNLVFASLDAYKTTMQHAKENTKHKIFDINTKTAKTFEQNSKELTKEEAQDSASRFKAYMSNNSNSGSNTANTTRTSTTTTYTSIA
jgi:hypothetical protein